MPKLIIFGCIIGVLFFLALTDVYSHEYHHSAKQSANNTTIINNHTGNGVALGLAAAQHNYYWGKSSLQGSAAVGMFDGKEAFSFGLAKKYKKTLINGSISKEGNKFGVGAGINWIF